MYIIAGLLVVIWGILYMGLNATGPVHILLVLAWFIVLVRIVFNKQLSGRKL
jgi:hypothetical protein